MCKMPKFFHRAAGGQTRGPLTREAAEGLHRLCTLLGRGAVLYGRRPDDPNELLPLLYNLQCKKKTRAAWDAD